jgi:hypothetical protein
MNTPAHGPADIPFEEKKRPAESPPLSEREVKKIIQTIEQVSSAPIELPELGEEDHEEDASDYWDASTMAPLNAASAVSNRTSSNPVYSQCASLPTE